MAKRLASSLANAWHWWYRLTAPFPLDFIASYFASATIKRLGSLISGRKHFAQAPGLGVAFRLEERCQLLKIFDISLPVSPDLPVWPGDPQVALERIRAKSEGSASNDSRLNCSVHSGTHVDAPLHFVDHGASVDQLPLDILVGPAVVVEDQSTDIITPDRLERLPIPEGTKRLLIKTRNSALWQDAKQAFNPDFAALDSQAARWIVDRGIQLVGIDYLSVQRFSDKDPATHCVLLEAGVIILEGLYMREVKTGSYQLICLPIKLVGSDGAPARTILIKE